MCLLVLGVFFVHGLFISVFWMLFLRFSLLPGMVFACRRGSTGIAHPTPPHVTHSTYPPGPLQKHPTLDPSGFPQKMTACG